MAKQKAISREQVRWMVDGVPAFYRPSSREPKEEEVVIRGEPWQLGDGRTWVVRLVGRSGGVSCSHLRPRDPLGAQFTAYRQIMTANWMAARVAGLCCRTCGAKRGSLTREQILNYVVNDGWPQCCGGTMELIHEAKSP